MTAGPCESFALLTTMCVHATFLGPPIVGLVTLRKYSRLTAKGELAEQPPKLAMAAVLCLPWIIGLVIGLVARADGKSGSYRGLLCYNTQWDSASTGGLTIAVFAVSTLVTAASYIAIAYKVRSSLRMAGSAHADGSFTALLKRGGALVLIFFLVWACFVVVVGLNMSHQPVSLTTEMLTALVIGLQPILDTAVLMQTPSVRAASIHRKYGAFFRTKTVEMRLTKDARPPPPVGNTGPSVVLHRASSLESMAASPSRDSSDIRALSGVASRVGSDIHMTSVSSTSCNEVFISER